MQRPVFPAHVVATETETAVARSLGRRTWRRPFERVFVLADRDSAGIDNPDHLFLIEIDQRQQAFDRPAPDVAGAGLVEAGHPDEAAPLLRRIGEIAGRERRAKQLVAAKIVIAPLARRRPPAGIGQGYPLRLPPFLAADRRLHARDRFPALDLARGEIDDCLMDRAIAAGDDEGLAREGLPRLPRQDLAFVGLVEIDQREAGVGIDIAGLAQHRDRGLDLLGGERIERMRRSLVNTASEREGGESRRQPRHSRRGSSASRRPSPNRFSDSTRMKIASPGQTAIHGACDMKFLAVLSMLPQEGLGGCWPRPRNDRLASAMIAAAVARVAWTRIGGTMLGKMWRSMMRRCGLPTARAASM